MLQHPLFLLELGSLSYAHSTLRRIQALGIPLPPRLGEILIAPNERSRLIEGALQTPLSDLAAFLGYAAKITQLEPIFKALTDDLARPENRKPLLERALQTPLHLLASFLGYAAKTTQLKPIFKAFVDDLARPENRKPLLERALQIPIGYLAAFLSYAANTAQLEPIFKALAADLARPENRKPLLERALQTQLHNLGSFLGYAAKTAQLEPIFKALAGELARPENRKPLLKQALKTQLGDLAAFLGYAAKTTQLKPIFKALAEDLARPENRRELATDMARLPLDALVGILTSETLTDLWDSIFTEVDATGWDKTRLLGENLGLNAFVAFQHIAYQRGRPEFAEAIAVRLIEERTWDEWHQPGIGLHHLSHVLRNARGAPPTQIECFLDSVATPEFVDGWMNSALPGGLAGSLLALANILEPERRRWFQRESLARRVANEVSPGRMYNTPSRADGLALLGAAAGIGMTNLIKDVRWLTSRELAEVLDLRAPDSDRTTIGPRQVQLWLGLREIARVSPDPVIVSPLLADQILNLWLATQESESAGNLPPHIRNINIAMIAWLQQCKAAGWRLVPPEELP